MKKSILPVINSGTRISHIVFPFGYIDPLKQNLLGVWELKVKNHGVILCSTYS